MAVIITNEDIRLIKQPSVECFVRINVLNDDGTILDSLDGLIAGGQVTIDANSDVRRTCNFTVIPTMRQDIIVNETSYIWLNRTIRMEVGIKDIRTGEITYYSQGHFIYTDTSGTYDASTNVLQVNCADFMAFLDGSRNGTLGQLQTIIPAYVEDSNTGEVIEYNYIRDAIITTVKQLGRIKAIQVEDVGEYKAFESRNKGYCVLDENTTLTYYMYSSSFTDISSRVFAAYSVYDFPDEGEEDVFYIHRSHDDVYLWNPLSELYELSDVYSLSVLQSLPTTGTENVIYIVSQTTSSDSILVDDVNFKTISQIMNEVAKGDYVIATGYALYRINNITWNSIPYDLEFSSGDSILSILTTLRDLYPNYEMFFDVNNVFVCQMKPAGFYDDIILSNEDIQELLISENTETTSFDFTEVKNISEVWGEVIEADFYTETGVTYTDNIYIVPNSAYVPSGGEARYYNGDTVAFNVPTTNLEAPLVNIENLGAIPIYDGENINRLKAGILIEGRTYTFKIKRTYSNGVYDVRAIYLGQYQPHGMTVLLNSAHHDETVVAPSGAVVELYSPEYFQEFYDVSPTALTREINEKSPFSIEKIGAILQVEQRESCTSDDLALAQSNYNNYLSTRLTDNISITMLLAPFLDVNIKVSYKPYNQKEENQYIIDSITHDFENGTTSVTMHRFYELYPDTI